MLWFSAAALAGMLGFLLKSRRNYEALPELVGGSNGIADVTAIVPARNEEGQIVRCVQSLTGTRTIVVDDGSSDRTAEAARAAGACVIEAPSLPAGVLGKPNACAAGARASASKWLLFVDADTWFAPGFADAMVGQAERDDLDLLTAFLRQQRETWAERIILPYAFALYFCGVSARSVNSPSGEALANGQCLLLRREAYNRIGGHDAVKTSVIEDVALARLAKQHGLRVRVVRAESLGSVRMYDGFGAIWRGLEKNSFRFLQANPGTGAQVIAASIALTSWLPALAVSATEGWWALAAVLLVAPAILLKRWYGSWPDALFAPAGIYAFQLIALAGMLKSLTGSKSTWKGRSV